MFSLVREAPMLSNAMVPPEVALYEYASLLAYFGTYSLLQSEPHVAQQEPPMVDGSRLI